MTGTVRKHIFFSGRVQGVGFRYHAVYLAREFDLTGWVRNCPDERVEMEIQGRPEAISAMLMRLRQQRYIQIDGMDVESIPLASELGFDVKG